MPRNRSEGWKHAKLSGHKNEDVILKKIINDSVFSKVLEKHLNCKIGSLVPRVGLKEEKVNSILGDKTTPKKDLEVNDSSGKIKRISIKKSYSGQVFLISVNRFIEGYEKHFQEKIPANVKKGLSLFFDEDSEIEEILKNPRFKIANKNVRKYEIRKRRLTCVTLSKFSLEIYEDLLNWFIKNIGNICNFCFAKGLAQHETNWAEYLWYKNIVDPKLKSLDSFFKIKDLCEACVKSAQSTTFYGSTNGGTTIQLPFGFLQWHKRSMQFHHQFKKIIKLF